MPIDTLKLAPSPAQWLSALRARTGSPRAAIFRSQLSLPTDRPVVMSGHQATIWHPGILAKRFALSAAAERAGAHAAWLVVDQDPEDPSTLQYPARPSADAPLHAQTWTWAPPRVPMLCKADIPPCAVPAFLPAPIPDADAPALSDTPAALLAVHTSLHAEALVAQSLAAQLACTVERLIAPYDPRVQLIYASQLARTDLFVELVSRMARDPHACAAAYNRAVAAAPDARLAPLRSDERACELPLWHVASPEQPRRRVYASELPKLLATTSAGTLLPRALFMTGLLRLAGCDLFIHGLGGAGADATSGYDQVTDLWFRIWLGEDFLGPQPLAHVTTTTATVTLPLLNHPPVSERTLRTAQWKLHAARHNPRLLLDVVAATRKQQHIAAIAGANSRTDRKNQYLAMHRELTDYRQHVEPQLAALQSEILEITARLRDQAIATRRDWPFPIYPSSEITALRDRINHAFASA
ncbi:MAG: hypothetical protein IBJ18_02995 [Phycisphaerales bacterium]|nr:hypothetical protein [Phycisphaerales bacterium]